MKKLFFLGALLTGTLAFTACTSDDDVNIDKAPNGGENFLSLSINLPTDPSTTSRAGDDNADEVTYDDGLENEYYVNDATLLIFGKDDDKLKGAYVITPAPWNANSDKNVTKTSTRVVQKVGTSVVAGDKLLVVLNSNGIIEVQADNTLKVMKDDGSALEAFDGTFDQFQKRKAITTGLNCGKMNDNGFYMANAPLAKNAGSGTTEPTDGSVQVLVPIAQTYETQNDAEIASAPDQIYVERGMAKVTMTKALTTSAMVTSKVGTTALNATIIGWTLDNTNPDSYLVRSTEDFSTATTGFFALVSGKAGSVYRSIGNTKIETGAPDFAYRTYFAKSANYDAKTTGASPELELNRFTLSGTLTGGIDDNFQQTFGNDHPQYCFENTFPVEEQIVSHTTLVQLAVQSKTSGPGAAVDLYTVNGNKSVVYKEADLTTLLQGYAFDFLKNKDLVESGTVNSKDITIEFTERSAADGTVEVKGLSYPSGESGKATLKTGALGANAVKYVNDQATRITKYLGGVSYYSIRIKHFGDNLTPWNSDEWGSDATKKPALENIYPGNSANNYLGRYGVLRNNWYDLQVSSIKMLGDAVPHTAEWPTTTDDELDAYISFQINVLSWAKRTQVETL